MICRLCLNTLDEQNAVLLFSAADNECNDNNKTIPENYLVHLISTHLYLCLSRDDAISTSICTDCCAQLESFHNFWKLVELKQTTLCSQFLEIDCDVNWSEEGDVLDVVQQPTAIIQFKQEPDPDLEAEREAGGGETPICYDALLVKDETEFHESYLKSSDPKAAAAAAANKFPCMFCEKSFKMRRYLEEHVATHTGDRPISCAYCNTAFRCRSNMYTHVKTKHTTQWQKARAERESAKVNSTSSSSNNNNNNNNNNNQSQRSVNGDSDKFVDGVVVPTQPAPPLEVEVMESMGEQQLHPVLKIPNPPPPASAVPPSPPRVAAAAPVIVPAPAPTATSAHICEVLPPPDIVIIKSEPIEANEAINLTVNKTCPTPVKRVTRASRRKTHSPKKVQHIERHVSASEDSSNEGVAELYAKRIKTELQTCKENELMFANYNAVVRQQLCAATVQQQQEQEQLLTAAMAAVSTSTAAAAAVALTSQSSEPAPVEASTPAPVPSALAAEAYTCSICGQQLRNQRALNNHLHNKHNTTSSLSLTVSICSSCGELAGNNHRCSSKAKYTCDVCSKSFKMKRYLEEHFATHTGVKLHTCAFCPTEFRSKSNMYHHTKRKHKLEWERSRATRIAAKSGVVEPPQEEPTTVNS